MKENIKDYLQLILWWTVIIVVVLIALACIGISIYGWINYGDKPIDEIPAWLLYFMFGKGE